MSKLIIARHGVTPYNEAGIWTGLTDIDMSKLGYQEAGQGATILAKYKIDVALSSALIRAQNTAKIIISKQHGKNIPLLITDFLNEKDYGIFTDKNKQQIKSEVGEKVFDQIRRGWDYEIKDGESLKDVYTRVLAVHQRLVLPILENGGNVLVSSHNNTLRAYVKELESIPDDQASAIELGTAEIRVYDFSQGTFVCEEKHAIGAVH